VTYALALLAIVEGDIAAILGNCLDGQFSACVKDTVTFQIGDVLVLLALFTTTAIAAGYWSRGDSAGGGDSISSSVLPAGSET
jgi:hypothetical protein